MSNSEPAPNRHHGFSLVELLVVLTIVGILAAIGAFYAQDRKGPAVEGVLSEFGGFLSDAKMAARGNGTQVAITPSGSGLSFAMNYAIANGPSGRYLHATSTAANQQCEIVTDITTEPAASAIASLQAALQSRKLDSVNIFSAGIWGRNLASVGLTFNNNGTAAQDGLVAVAGIGTPAKAPVGIILVMPTGSMLRYYRPDSGANWVRK